MSRVRKESKEGEVRERVRERKKAGKERENAQSTQRLLKSSCDECYKMHLKVK